ncbi:MAG: hypothetical protein A3B86_01070 [Candidatus Yanofskybacteria bacterium RIFCSPHIGHO2_02_FULL_38_22b]|uniref:Uncharacterized protein n=1 Tax=Candidatus Yanofskybacteria bacterium RIFCSPHIGHO2_02_FULL_38_22b TaxID=1802673 RepID=A0A1F8F4Z8_9BACT|nr:MAG: hypothetical protein A3B86_01070 [Candidatus Yanofskybacteria bacterium RIFCSPHIGHO2_02_FULL_38_22b]OGN20384.1 MAG: hypothetical protein A2910_01420 [Candidatus Yanofskybacteria bacterium RIFCSPLOWO2_01_FULL_39_28]
MTQIIERLIASLGSFSLPSFSGVGPGWLFGAFGALAVSLFGLSMGRTKAVISLLSIYIAFTFEKLFPYWDSLGNLLDEKLAVHWIRLILFFSAYLLVFIIFNISFIRKRLSSSEYSLLGILILSLFQFGFLASIIFNILPEELTIRWSFGFYKFFATPTALFLWALAPLPVLAFIRK